MVTYEIDLFIHLSFSSWSGEDAERRATFCGNQKLFEMFRTVCSCTSPAPISFQDDPGLDALEDVPILVMAANRPKYLFRTLFNILNAEGVNRANIVVSIDGFFAESVAVANLFAIRKGSSFISYKIFIF